MNVVDAQTQLGVVIGAVRNGDDEVAHAKEDALHQSVLRWIADHSTDEQAATLAGIALRTRGLDFSRWYA